MRKDGKIVDLQAVAQDEEVLRITAEIEQAGKPGATPLWSEEFAASGEKNQPM